MSGGERSGCPALAGALWGGMAHCLRGAWPAGRARCSPGRCPCRGLAGVEAALCRAGGGAAWPVPGRHSAGLPGPKSAAPSCRVPVWMRLLAHGRLVAKGVWGKAKAPGGGCGGERRTPRPSPCRWDPTAASSWGGSWGLDAAWTPRAVSHTGAGSAGEGPAPLPLTQRAFTAGERPAAASPCRRRAGSTVPSLQQCHQCPSSWDGDPVPPPCQRALAAVPSLGKLRHVERQRGLTGCIPAGAELEQSPGVPGVERWKNL